MSRVRRTRTQIDQDAMAIKSELDYTTRVCRKCEEEKHITDFRERPNSGDGYHTQCKQCTDANSEKHNQKNILKRREQQRVRNLKAKFGITPDQYDELLIKQDNACAICDRKAEEFKTRLAVDHNHVTGEIRGLLCNYCNHRVIGRHRNGALLRKMADYVDGGTGWFVPPKMPKKRKKKIVK